MEIVQYILVAGQEARESRSHADRDAGADRLDGVRPSEAEQQRQQQDV